MLLIGIFCDGWQMGESSKVFFTSFWMSMVYEDPFSFFYPPFIWRRLSSGIQKCYI